MSRGVGTVLKEKLSWFEPKGGCVPCNQKANLLDVNGPDWAERNIDTVSSWLVENARKRTIAVAIPGINQVTKLIARDLVARAIETCREEAKAEAENKKLNG